MRSRSRSQPAVDAASAIADKEFALGDVLDFMRLLWAMDHGLHTLSKRMREDFGVTGAQRLVIRIVGRFPNIRPKRLAEILHVHPSTLTGVLRRLEDRGLLERAVDPEDARRFLLSLTALGRGINKTRAETVEARISAVLSKQPEARVEEARAVLAAIVEALSKR